MKSFIEKHKELHDALSAYCVTSPRNFGCYKSEAEMRQANKFPCVGLFLGSPIISDKISSFLPETYTYLLVVANLYSIDEATSEYDAQKETYKELVGIINAMNYDIEDMIESYIMINENEGSFMTGWIAGISTSDIH